MSMDEKSLENLEKTRAALNSPKAQALAALRTVPWFAMPFLAMWGMGVAVEDAARFAVAPWACGSVCMSLSIIAAAFVGIMISQQAKA